MLSKWLVIPTILVNLRCPAHAQETCPQIPDTGVEIGQPVPIVPGDIPPGCSDFEILVGMLTLHRCMNYTDSKKRAVPVSPVFRSLASLLVIQ